MPIRCDGVGVLRRSPSAAPEFPDNEYVKRLCARPALQLVTGLEDSACDWSETRTGVEVSHGVPVLPPANI